MPYWMAAARSSGVTTFTAQWRSSVSSAFGEWSWRWRSVGSAKGGSRHRLTFAHSSDGHRRISNNLRLNVRLARARGVMTSSQRPPPPPIWSRHHSRSRIGEGTQTGTRGRPDVLRSECGSVARYRTLPGVHPGRPALRSRGAVRRPPRALESRSVHGDSPTSRDETLSRAARARCVQSPTAALSSCPRSIASGARCAWCSRRTRVARSDCPTASPRRSSARARRARAFSPADRDPPYNRRADDRREAAHDSGQMRRRRVQRPDREGRAATDVLRSRGSARPGAARLLHPRSRPVGRAARARIDRGVARRI